MGRELSGVWEGSRGEGWALCSPVYPVNTECPPPGKGGCGLSLEKGATVSLWYNPVLARAKGTSFSQGTRCWPCSRDSCYWLRGVQRHS